jgi:hypothetical protein
MVCPVWSLDEWFESFPKEKRAGKKDQLRDGRMVAYHVLDACELPGHSMPHLVVDLGGAFSVPIEYARQLAVENGSRLRLQPPYREHLSQSFARFFMRVGLPTPVTPFPK